MVRGYGDVNFFFSISFIDTKLIKNLVFTIRFVSLSIRLSEFQKKIVLVNGWFCDRLFLLSHG
jgi:hypothetical protein